MERLRKVRNEWRNGDESVRKVWCFDAENREIYSRNHLENEQADMFPQLKSKGYRLELSYEDSLVGKTTMDSDSDVKETFSEEHSLSFRTIFITDA